MDDKQMEIINVLVEMLDVDRSTTHYSMVVEFVKTDVDYANAYLEVLKLKSRYQIQEMAPLFMSFIGIICQVCKMKEKLLCKQNG